MDYFLVLDPQHYFAWSLVLSFAVMSCSLSCLCASVPVLSLWYCSCCCSLASCSLSVHQSCLQWQNIAPYHEFFDRSLKNLHSSPLQFQQHLELIHALSSLHIKIASSPGSRQGAERNMEREPGVHCTAVSLVSPKFRGFRLFPVFSPCRKRQLT